MGFLPVLSFYYIGFFDVNMSVKPGARRPPFCFAGLSVSGMIATGSSSGLGIVARTFLPIQKVNLYAVRNCVQIYQSYGDVLQDFVFVYLLVYDVILEY